MSESFGIIMPRRTIITDYGWSAPPPSAASPTWTPSTTSPAWQGNGSNSGNTSLTFTSVDLRNPIASDVIVIGVATVAVGSIASVTVGGSSATQQVATGLVSSRQCAIYSITGLTAATANIVVSTSAGALGDAVVCVGKLTGVNSTPGTSDHQDMQSLTAPATENVTVTVPSSGFGIFFGFDITNETYTVTNVTVDFTAGNADAVGGLVKFGHNSTPGSQTVTGQGSSGGYLLAAAFTPWGP